jgi:hypothetical protein
MAIDALRAALAQQQAEPVATCFCGSPQILNTWHRKDGPCFAPRTAEPVQAEPVACFCGDPTILNVWHRKDGPCLPKAEPVQAEPVGEIYRRAAGAACGSSMTQAESGNPSF